ncbi:hypothetical protein I3843_15G050300 [Carya illinoinensis]|uniref:RING-type E3 ubiquitin transferase n=1 Tax=Carya illinoinensis TaxID=32201 RepID=A0A922A667_CARIL|nr:hypothetical protein I3842_15G053000 [Carya illinoinensis]KAG6674630.1 hypothetical protein I3842_15G053000 [Carya illinoinensis]KAG6674631.1 hypothetical protein I3842_15G053000 [Carya illinoinensis]KAG7943606.1 hypothetical protein I3843_15G050300 [Carya illinoinensis]KAG7943607.1 hypothetical protein I3843_15G050300 [Carya illinoinensis]
MQGQRGRLDALPETLEFDHGSASSNAAIDQQICWNNMRNPAGNQIQDYVLSPGDLNVAYLNSLNRERPVLNGWSLGEPSSSNTQSEVRCDERKAELGWSSSGSACPGAGLRLEERSYELSNAFSAENANSNHQYVQSSNSDVLTQNLNLNTGSVSHGGDSRRVTGFPNFPKSSILENQCIPPASGSDHHLLPSRTGGVLVAENDGRSGCSLEGHRVSCKRKSLEANVGQSSVSGSSSYFQCTENSAWSPVPSHFSLSRSLSVSAPSEQVNPRVGLGATEVTSGCIPDPSSAGSSHRTSRVRINPPTQPDSIPPTLIPTERPVRHSSISTSQLPPRLLPVDYSLDLRSTPAADNMIPHSQPLLIHLPEFPRNVQGFRWNGRHSSGTASSTSSNVSGDRDAVLRNETGSRSMERNLSEHPMFVPSPEPGNLVRNPAHRSSTGGNLRIPGNVASTSRTGLSSGVHPSSAPTLASQLNPPQYPRRLSEYVRRSLFSSTGSEPGGQSSNYSPLRSGPVSSQEMGFSSGPGNQGHHQLHPRSALWVERQSDGGPGIPYLLRANAVAGEGSSRLVSEIRNVLGLMRRGENLRFEDVMILDQSMFFGVADIHDRHRDMRLDVDNMSYEELLALEERIGNVSTGLSEETISNRLKRRKYSIVVKSQLEAEPCCICQEEYNEGDDLGTPECGHDFHVDCIKQWLMHKNLCPICKTTALTK